jgi:hypothetical protein
VVAGMERGQHVEVDAQRASAVTVGHAHNADFERGLAGVDSDGRSRVFT